MKLRTLSIALIIGVALFAVLFVATAPANAEQTFAPREAGGVITYTVRVGDTWSRIANMFGVSSGRLLDFNERRTTNRISLFAGEVLKIPIDLGTTPSLTAPFLYTVQAGDTVESVTKKFLMDKYWTLYANGLPQTQTFLTVGQTILIPAGPHRYVVQKGDSLPVIAALFGTTADKLLPSNPQLSGGKIFFPGMYVYIPVIHDIGFTISPFAASGGGGGPSTGTTTTGTSTSTTSSSTGLTASPPNPGEVARAANASVITVVETITLPQNVINLNQAFQIRTVRLNNVQRDFTRDNGAIITATLQFRGGTGTYLIRRLFNNLQSGVKMTGIYVNNDNGQLWNDIDMPFETTCTATLPIDLFITTGGATIYHHFEFKNIQCP